MCSGERSSSANGAIALRQSAARSWSTSSSMVLSDWTMRGPSFIGDHRGGVSPGTRWNSLFPAEVSGGKLQIHRVPGETHGDAGSSRCHSLLPGPVGRDVGPRGAPVGAVAAGGGGGGGGGEGCGRGRRAPAGAGGGGGAGPAGRGG